MYKADIEHLTKEGSKAHKDTVPATKETDYLLLTGRQNRGGRQTGSIVGGSVAS